MSEVLSRWYIAMPLVYGAVGAAIFLVIYGAATSQPVLVSGGSGALFTQFGAVIGYYFRKGTE